ncbi:hypothetical protein F8M49_10400 [Rhodococcus zopfii]|uniref:Uncharacterized protein n=1 Tax=Rhodococcus zopfii TaxID=43772 RepID=A0ABU3WQ05_9NOCA|nr:hypothetical protein [Rhodococcus zopfii]
MDTIARVGDRVAEIAAAIRPGVTEFLEREPGFSSHFNAGKEDFGYTGANVPLLLKGLARISQAGGFLSADVCDLSRARSGCDLARGVDRHCIPRRRNLGQRRRLPAGAVRLSAASAPSRPDFPEPFLNTHCPDPQLLPRGAVCAGAGFACWRMYSDAVVDRAAP